MAAEAVRRRYGLNEAQVWPHEYVAKQIERINPELLSGPDLPDVTVDAALDAAIADLESVRRSRASAVGSPRVSPDELTPREREVLELVVAGRSNAEIGDALFISRKTASVHVANIKGKLGADSRIGIVTTAMQQGLVNDQRAVASDT